MDGWGFSNWAKLLAEYYGQASLTLTASNWSEIALDDEKYTGSAQYDRDKKYWAGHLKEISPPPLQPHYQNKFSDAKKVRSQRRVVEISRTQLDRFKSAAASVNAGVSQHMLAMLAVYFSKVLGQDSVVFGIPMHNRRNHHAKEMLGVFTNISPLCIEMKDGRCTFGELVQSISRKQKTSFRHQRYPLGHIVRDLAEAGQRRIYDIAFNHLKLFGDLPFGEESSSLMYLSHNHEATPLMFTLCECGELGAVQLQVDYNLAFVNDADTERLIDRFSYLLQILPAAYDVPIADLNILPNAETHQLIQGFGDAALRPISNLCIHQLFEAQVMRVPGAIAVSSGDEEITYRELDRRANIAGNYLIGLGVGPESLVGIYLNRSVDLLAGVLGVLKAGGAYVPLDQSSPLRRIRTIVEDGGIQFVLTERDLADRIPLQTARLVLLDEIPEDAFLKSNAPESVALGLTSANSAYVIFTSGSTGTPKGVQICHQSAVSLLDWARATYTVEELNKVLACTSLGFDLSVFEMFAPLSVGGQCVIVKDALELLANRVDVSLMNTVPSAIKALIEHDSVPSGVRVINLAGEPLPMHVVNDLLSTHKCEKVFNLYGPSEDTTYSTGKAFSEAISNAPSIGRAIPGTRLYVLSPTLTLVPMGSVGELYIAGAGLARGYLRRPDLTAERFIPDPFSMIGGERLYKTGDLVRYRDNGDLDYVGRADGQLKIRGFRIELGEIQKQLEALDDVKMAIVLPRGNTSSDQYLAAYIERETKERAGLSDGAWVEGVQRALRGVLPTYMVPASITVLREMPLTSNGKINKQALLALNGEITPQARQVSPETITEIKLAKLWARILDIDQQQVGVTNSLFDMGGHSLLLLRLANDIRVQLGITLPVRTFFDVSNLRELADKIDTEVTLQVVETKLNSAAIVTQGYL
jgi:amino acid adenylation domain-containing protein